MVEWVNIPDEVLEPGKPIRSVDGFAMRDNPMAIAEGADGAPRIKTPAYEKQSVTTQAIADQNVTAIKLADDVWPWVTSKLSAAGLGAVGTSALLKGPFSIDPGTVVSGSSLYYANAASYHSGSPRPTGSWRCMGYTGSSYTPTEEDVTPRSITLWLRVA